MGADVVRVARLDERDHNPRVEDYRSHSSRRASR